MWSNLAITKSAPWDRPYSPATVPAAPIGRDGSSRAYGRGSRPRPLPSSSSPTRRAVRGRGCHARRRAVRLHTVGARGRVPSRRRLGDRASPETAWARRSSPGSQPPPPRPSPAGSTEPPARVRPTPAPGPRSAASMRRRHRAGLEPLHLARSRGRHGPRRGGRLGMPPPAIETTTTPTMIGMRTSARVRFRPCRQFRLC
jgi:hypothetical protein